MTSVPCWGQLALQHNIVNIIYMPLYTAVRQRLTYLVILTLTMIACWDIYRSENMSPGGPFVRAGCLPFYRFSSKPDQVVKLPPFHRCGTAAPPDKALQPKLPCKQQRKKKHATHPTKTKSFLSNQGEVSQDVEFPLQSGRRGIGLSATSQTNPPGRPSGTLQWGVLKPGRSPSPTPPEIR